MHSLILPITNIPPPPLPQNYPVAALGSETKGGVFGVIYELEYALHTETLGEKTGKTPHIIRKYISNKYMIVKTNQ